MRGDVKQAATEVGVASAEIVGKIRGMGTMSANAREGQSSAD